MTISIFRKHLLRSFSTTTKRQLTDDNFTAAFEAATSAVNGKLPFNESADVLRSIIKTDLVKATDIRDDPAKFFEAHRILARHALDHGPGFWIRFTVHYNLCFGTVLAVGSDEQIDALADIQAAGELGCFSLTEKKAGVQSGLVVETTCEYDEGKDAFVLNTPNYGARKNWISQGFVADKTVVLADLIVKGETKGPHAFLMDFRKNGALVENVKIDDMGGKTVGNDLDNAWIEFNRVELPKSAMLSRYADIVDGNYTLKVEGVRPFDMIGQRLYTGRVAVAQGALEYRRQLFARTREYAENKLCPGDIKLGSVPQLRFLFEENDSEMKMLDEFVKQTELALSDCLTRDELPSSALVDAIAVCKVEAVERSIAMCHRLKQEVGSFALMQGSGFENQDFLQCCKFAEGDSRILKLKLARDAMKAAGKGKCEGMSEEELELCAELCAIMSQGNKVEAFNNEWERVYRLADAVIERVKSERKF